LGPIGLNTITTARGPLRKDGVPLRILIFSDDANVRERVKSALGHRIYPELPEMTYVDVATGPVVLQEIGMGAVHAARRVDVAILDGEAVPYGGMGIAKQLRDEIAPCPPIVLLTGRADDSWLATWSWADAIVPRPIDPFRLTEAVVALIAPAHENRISTTSRGTRVPLGRRNESVESDGGASSSAVVPTPVAPNAPIGGVGGTNMNAAGVVPPTGLSVRVSLPTDFPAQQVAPYAEDAFRSMGDVQSQCWHRGVFELRMVRTAPNGHQTELMMSVTPRPDGRSYIRLHEGNILDAQGRDESLHALQSGLNRIGRFLAAASRLRNQTRQAVIVVPGIGEQRPSQTLRSFMDGVFGGMSPQDWFVKPDYVSKLFELRSMRLPPNVVAGRPRTDVYELYWAHLIRDTTLGQVYGWLLRLLFARNKNIPPALFKRFWGARAVIVIIIVAGALGWLYYNRTGPHTPPVGRTAAPTGALWTAGMTAVVLAVIPSFAWAFLRLAQNRLLLGFLGDAARYLEPRPDNVERRQAIREAGVQLLDGLHDSGHYSRIVVFGHSLGSVIAYDILSLSWARRCRKYNGGNVMTSRELMGLEGQLNPRGGLPGTPPVGRIRDRQFGAWEEYRRNGFRWLVSDFVTAGSPLTSASLLLNLDRHTPFAELRVDRTFPGCPPETEEALRGSKRKRFSYTLAYRDPLGSDRARSVQVPHYAALFALIRWTNLYFPMHGPVGGDPIGGPLKGPFGEWINDVELPQPAGGCLGFAHTLYWKPMRINSFTERLRRKLAFWKPARDNTHIDRLRDALALPFHGTLDDLTMELYAKKFVRQKPNLKPLKAYRFLTGRL
jgi:CheY-like chemotaxis protein